MAETRSSTGPWVFAGLALLSLVLALVTIEITDALRDAAWVEVCNAQPMIPHEDEGYLTDPTRGYPECADVRREETHPR